MQAYGSSFQSWRRSAAGALLGALILIARSDALAEGAGPSTPDGVTGTFGEASPQGAVDESTGAMGYSIPFQLPAARGDAQPSLSLHYRSNSGTGEAGEDWSLNIPSIERAPLSNWPKYLDNNIDSGEDRYTYGGQPLSYVCTVGPENGCRPEYGQMPAWALGYRHYRLRVDRTGERFFLDNTAGTPRRRWLVQRRGGQIMEFGEAKTRPELAPPATDIDSSTNKVFRWNLARQYDLHGIESAASSGVLGAARNLVVYKWSQSTTTRNVLTDIFYSPPVSSGTLSEFAYHVQLDWEASGGSLATITGPIARIDRQRPSQRLRRVAIAAKPWSQTGSRDVLRQYHLTYYSPRFLTGEAPLWYRSFLKEAQVEGRCGAVESGNSIPATTCPRLPPQTFEYESASIAIGEVSQTSLAGGRQLDFPDNTIMADVDRDGRTDIIQGWPQNRQVASNAAAWYTMCSEPNDSNSLVDRWVDIRYTNGVPELICTDSAGPPPVLGPASSRCLPRSGRTIINGVAGTGTQLPRRERPRNRTASNIPAYDHPCRSLLAMGLPGAGALG